MRGLLQRGLEIRRRIAGRSSSDDQDIDSSISEEDRQEILQEIERVTASNRIRVEDGAFEVSPIHKRAYFPLFVNVASVAVLALGLFGLYRFFQAQERAVSRQAEAVVSGEARLIRQLQEESEQRMRQKEQEISSIQDRLRQIAEEREAIEENMEAEIRAREEELVAEFERRRAAEQDRLADQGLSPAEIEERMSQLQAQQEAQLADALANARSQAEAERERIAANLADLQSEYDQALQAAEAEQAALRREAEDRAAELEAQYGAQLSETMDELERLADERQQETRVRTQIAGYYDAVQRDMRAGNYGDALVTLDALRAYLFEPTVERVSSVAERRPTELFVISSLQDLIEQERSTAESDTEAVLASAQRVGTVTQIASDAAAALQRGDREAAAELYARALEALPPALESHAFLTGELESRLQGQHDTAMRDQRADAAEAAERRVQAARQEATAAAEEEADRRLLAALDDARRAAEAEREAAVEAAVAEAIVETRREAQTALDVREAELEARIAELESAITSLRDEVEAAEQRVASGAEALSAAEDRIASDAARIAALSEEVQRLSDHVATLQQEKLDLAARFDAVIRNLERRADSTSPRALAQEETTRDLASLLGTTVTLRRVLSSEFVRSQYPTLYEDTDEYLAALAQESRERGRREALDEFLAVVSAVESGADLELGDADPESIALIARLLGHVRDMAAASRE